MALQIIEKKMNKNGITYCIAKDAGRDTFGVWKLCENYAPHCAGGMSRTWRYVQKGLGENLARTLFARRAA